MRFIRSHAACTIAAQTNLCWWKVLCEILAASGGTGTFSKSLFGMESDGWALDGSAFAWCILASVMDPQCLKALNQPRGACGTALAAVQSAQVGRVTADLPAVLGDGGRRRWTLDLPLLTVGWFFSCPNS